MYVKFLILVDVLDLSNDMQSRYDDLKNATFQEIP